MAPFDHMLLTEEFAGRRKQEFPNGAVPISMEGAQSVSHADLIAVIARAQKQT